ncbi:MAG: lamin tail domain-containing protein, partial [Acidobacteriota bacterium]
AFRNDFIELFNRGTTPRALGGWALQYTSAAGTTWTKTDLTGAIAPGQYLLIQLASGGANGAPIPTPDVSGSIAMAATAGKVALTNSVTPLAGGCPASNAIVDMVGYGTSANCFEGSGPTPAPSNINAIRRAGNGCQDTDQNAADFSAASASPRNSNSPLGPCVSAGGPRFRPDDLKVTVTESEPCLPFTVEAQMSNTGNRTQRDNPGPEFVVELPPGLVVVPGSCRATGTGSCAEVASSRIEWSGSVAAGETISLSWQVKLSVESTQPGDRLCLTSTVHFDSNDDGSNEASTAATSCLVANCQPGSPGIPYPASAEHGGDRSGSVLIFPFFTSNASAPETENTAFNVTNANPTRGAAIHLFFVSDDSTSIADTFLCLSPSQTRSFLASEIDPNTAGYVVGVAVDVLTGCPIGFNHLFGEELVKLASGHAGTLLAEAFGAVSGNPVECTGNSATAELRFDGQSYDGAARMLAIDSIPSATDGFVSLLVVNRLGGNLLSGASTIGQLSGLVFNDAEESFSYALSTSRRQFRVQLGDNFPRTSPRLSELIPAGRTGWSKIWLTSDGAILGALLVSHPQVRVSAAAMSGGRALHKLTLSDSARLTIPVFPPSC